MKKKHWVTASWLILTWTPVSAQVHLGAAASEGKPTTSQTVALPFEVSLSSPGWAGSSEEVPPPDFGQEPRAWVGEERRRVDVLSREIDHALKNSQEKASRRLFDGGGLRVYPSVSLMGGAGATGTGAVGTAGGMLRVGFGTAKFGSVGPEGGLVWSGRGHSNRLLRKDILDYNRSGRVRDYEIYTETTQHIYGLQKFEFFGLGYQTPEIARRLTFAAGWRLGYAKYDPRTRVEERKYIRELRDNSPCYDQYGNVSYGRNCQVWDTRLLDQRTVSVGPGEKKSSLGHAVYAAANFALTPTLGIRFEGTKDRYKLPEASGYGFRGGAVFSW